jgi:cytochrome c-type biogenesis protein CcmE
VTDLARTVEVVYRGALPDLFREGQGVVAEGTIGPDGVFRAAEVLAKHDEKYMPPEVADALKKSGRWQEGPAPLHPAGGEGGARSAPGEVGSRGIAPTLPRPSPPPGAETENPR